MTNCNKVCTITYLCISGVSWCAEMLKLSSSVNIRALFEDFQSIESIDMLKTMISALCDGGHFVFACTGPRAQS